jgi:phytoene synthase
MLVDGVGSDLTRLEMSSWSELRAYCVQVASSVGLAMCHLLGAGEDPLAREAAVELGIGMQLTNILRDVGADLAMGRVYLTTDDLQAHRYSRERLAWLAARMTRHGAHVVDDDFKSLMRAQIERARMHYARGMGGIDRLPRDYQLPILVAARLYRGILDEIEAADYDVFTRRAATSTVRKLAEAARCAFVLRSSSLAVERRTLARS